MDIVPPILEDICTWFQPRAAKRTIINVVGKLIFVTSAYHVWLERNNRLFKNTRRYSEELRDLIVVTVHLKLATLRFRNKMRVMSLLALWKMPSKFRTYKIYTILNAPAGRLLGAYDLEVATPRAVVHAGDKTSGDARSWYMISRDAKSWVCDCFTYIHCVFDKGKWLVLEINDVHPWGFGIQD
ncbi:hypothetical protein Tco_0720587, partial [Tanacetum coccineum]